MSPKAFGISTNLRAVDEEADDLADQLEAQS
jgi:hypothetical protein